MGELSLARVKGVQVKFSRNVNCQKVPGEEIRQVRVFKFRKDVRASSSSAYSLYPFLFYEAGDYNDSVKKNALATTIRGIS